MVCVICLMSNNLAITLFYASEFLGESHEYELVWSSKVGTILAKHDIFMFSTFCTFRIIQIVDVLVDD